MFYRSLFVLFIVINGCTSEIKENGLSHERTVDLLSPEQQLESFILNDDFVIELIASEADGIINPIQIVFDDMGRLWTQTATMYPLDPIVDISWNELIDLMNDPDKQSSDSNFMRVKDLYTGRMKGDDKILIISGLYGDLDNIDIKVWADGLAIPMSILPYKTGAYVAQGSEIFYLDDTNLDGYADSRKPLFTGFGFTDSHTMPHLLTRAPKDWIYFSHGALNKGKPISLISGESVEMNYSKIGRFSLDGEAIEVVSAGLNNIWGFVLRDNGEWFGIEANDLSYSVTPMEPGTAFPGIGNEKLHRFQPFFPKLNDFRVGGSGLSGLAFNDNGPGGFPEIWDNVAFLANPITNSINCVKIKRNPDGTVDSEHLPDLLVSSDNNFRPVNIVFGPDGCLYIADWYNKIISHNEIPTSHPDRDKKHGRIWRIKHKKQAEREIPNFYEINENELVGFLTSSNLWEKRAAWHQIVDRDLDNKDHIIDELLNMVMNTDVDEITRIHALWALEGLEYLQPTIIYDILKSNFSDDLRREAIRSMTSFDFGSEFDFKLLRKIIKDESNPMIRSQVLRTLIEIYSGELEILEIFLSACQPDLKGNNLGGSYERKFERYLALMGLEKYPKLLFEYLKNSENKIFPRENLLWGMQALPEKERIQIFKLLWDSESIEKLDNITFIWISELLHDEYVYNTVSPLLSNSKYIEEYFVYALNNIELVYSEHLSRIFQNLIDEYFAIYSSNIDKVLLGLRVAHEFKLGIKPELIAELLNSSNVSSIVDDVVRVLSLDVKDNKNDLIEIVSNYDVSSPVQLEVINKIASMDYEKAYELLKLHIDENTNKDNKELTRVLHYNMTGIELILQLFSDSILTASDFEFSVAKQININKSNEISQKLFESSQTLKKEKAIEEKEKFNQFLEILNNGNGDIVNGEKIFKNTCLSCHSLGNNGFDIAPALDGSANRDNNALLTAIVYPDAAVESSYLLYRVHKTDGTVVEGYLYSKDNNGVTIALMGGRKIFIPGNEVEMEDFVANRSFMPSGLLDNFSDEMVADLFAYIQTLK